VTSYTAVLERENDAAIRQLHAALEIAEARGQALKRLSDVVICDCAINWPEPDGLCEPHAIIFLALRWCRECGAFAAVDDHADDCTANRAADAGDPITPVVHTERND